MENYKERLIEEQKELKEKVSKLTEFMNSEDYYKLSPNNRLVLKNQKIAMDLYLQVLNTRVFEDVDKIYVPDYALMYVFGTAFSGNFGFGNTNSFNQLKESTDKVEEKEEQAVVI
jgi:hypothetical protein